jgi:hypothetical protein
VVFWTDSSRVGDLCYLLVGRISYQDDHSDATDHAALRSRRPSHRPAAGRALRLSDHTAALHRPTNCTRPVCRRHSAGSRQPKRIQASLSSCWLTANVTQDSKAQPASPAFGAARLGPEAFFTRVASQQAGPDLRPDRIRDRHSLSCTQPQLGVAAFSCGGLVPSRRGRRFFQGEINGNSDHQITVRRANALRVRG